MRTIIRKGYALIGNYIENHFYQEKLLQSLKEKRAEILERGMSGYRIRTEELDLEGDWKHLLERCRDISGESVIADVDHDGYFLSYIGELHDMPTVTKEKFKVRRRSDLFLVDSSGWTGLRKDYRGRFWAFICELRALHVLAEADIHIPAVMNINFETPSLTVSYIHGKNLAEELAKRGVMIRNRDFMDNPEYRTMHNKERWKRAVEAARDVIYEVIDNKFVDELLEQMAKMHQHRICWNDIKYGNIMIEQNTGKPFLIDFDHAGYYPHASDWIFKQLSSRDLSLIRALFHLEGEAEYSSRGLSRIKSLFDFGEETSP